ncbi:MAG: oligosaccharide flippase family protein [Kangiellaceae bacterium]|nr:oligosaccharide flippase family protein [Kangiellaceae bacterium]
MSKDFKSLVKNTSILGGARVVEFIAGLVKVKLGAVMLGTVGIGVFSQLNFLSQKLSNFTMLSTGEALVKQVAENADNDESRQLILSALKSYILLVSFFMLASLVVLFILSEKITLYVFGDLQYFHAFLIALVSLPLLILNSIPYALMRAFKDLKAIAKARVLIVVINLVHSLPLIYFFYLEGAVASVFFSHLIGLLINYLLAKKLYFQKYNISLVNVFKAQLIPKFVKELVKFSGFGLSIGLYVIVSEFVCRGIVVTSLGIEAIGLYSPVVMWSTLFTGFLVPALTTYLYSSLCQAKNNSEISLLLNDGLRLATFGLIPLLFLAIPFRDLIIAVFYSSDFLEVGKYLPFHFLGVVFHVWFSVLGKSMTSTGRIGHHGFFRFLFLSLDIGVTYYCVLEWGLYGWMLKHIVSPVIFYNVYLIYCKRNMSLKLSVNNVSLMFYLLLGSGVLICVDAFFDLGAMANYFIGPVLLFFSWHFLRGFEKQLLITKSKRILQRIGLSKK